MIMASNEGGMDIEEVAKNRPQSLVWQPIDIMEGTVNIHTYGVLMLQVHRIGSGVGIISGKEVRFPSGISANGKLIT